MDTVIKTMDKPSETDGRSHANKLFMNTKVPGDETPRKTLAVHKKTFSQSPATVQKTMSTCRHHGRGEEEHDEAARAAVAAH